MLNIANGKLRHCAVDTNKKRPNTGWWFVLKLDLVFDLAGSFPQ
jgi:hypothetical protein